MSWKTRQLQQPSGNTIYFSAQDLTKYIRDELKGEAALMALQYIVRSGIERIELRDEILCQLIRQTNDNPDADSLRQAWVVLCLCTAAFSPSKNLHKVGEFLFCLSIDDRLYSTILHSLKQTYCAHMWFYMSDEFFIAL